MQFKRNQWIQSAYFQEFAANQSGKKPDEISHPVIFKSLEKDRIYDSADNGDKNGQPYGGPKTFGFEIWSQFVCDLNNDSVSDHSGNKTNSEKVENSQGSNIQYSG